MSVLTAGLGSWEGFDRAGLGSVRLQVERGVRRRRVVSVTLTGNAMAPSVN